MADNEQELLFIEGGRFLAPGSVGSSIQWFVRVHTYEINYGDNKGKRTSGFSGCVNISDCDRRISWSIYDVDKLDRAISELQKMRQAVLKAKKVRAKHKLEGEEDDDE